MAERDVDLLIVLPESNPIDVLYLSGGEQGASPLPAPSRIRGSCSAVRTATWPSSAQAWIGSARKRDALRLDQSALWRSGGRQAATARMEAARGSHRRSPRPACTRTCDRLTVTRSTRPARRIIDGLDGCEIVNGAAGHVVCPLCEERSRDRRVPRSASRSPKRVLAAPSVRRSASARRRPMRTAPASPRCSVRGSASRRSRGAPGRGRHRDRGSSAHRRATSSTVSAWQPRSCRARG